MTTWVGSEGENILLSHCHRALALSGNSMIRIHHQMTSRVKVADNQSIITVKSPNVKDVHQACNIRGQVEVTSTATQALIPSSYVEVSQWLYPHDGFLKPNPALHSRILEMIPQDTASPRTKSCMRMLGLAPDSSQSSTRRLALWAQDFQRPENG